MSNPLLSWVISQTISQSLSRGRNYRENIKHLKEYEPGYWKAKAFGTEIYEVEICHLGNEKFEATCDCPYDKGGLCKHIVAMAYEIAEHNDFSSSSTKLPNYQEKISSKDREQFFDELFLKQNEKIRNDFLRKLFAKDEALRNQFLIFAAQEIIGTSAQNKTAKTVVASKKIDITALVAKIVAKLTDLSLDYEDYYDGSRHHRSRGYNYYDGEDYEDVDNWATEQIEKKLKKYQNNIANYLKTNDLRSAIDTYIVLYLVSVEGDEICSGIFEDGMQSVLSDIIRVDEGNIVNFIEKAILLDTTLHEYSDYLLNFWQGEKVELHIEAFTPFLIALNEKDNIAAATLNFIKAKQLIFSGSAAICFYLAEKIGDATFWFLVAEKLYQDDSEVAILYLNRLKEEKSILKFHAILYETWGHNKQLQSNLAKKYKDDLIFSQNAKIYLAVWEHVVSNEMSLEAYKNLENYWLLSQKNTFIEAQKSKNPTFFAQLLKYENRHEQLLEFVQKFESYWDEKYTLLEFIGDIYPEETFTIFQQMVVKDEEQMKMDRGGYATLCEKLLYMNKINIEKAKKQQIVNRLRVIYTGRPAFQDELRNVVRNIGLE